MQAAALDWAVGELVDGLKDSGHYDNTVIIYTSDNGAQPGQGGTNYPLRGWKTQLYEGGIKVPTIPTMPTIPAILIFFAFFFFLVCGVFGFFDLVDVREACVAPCSYLVSTPTIPYHAICCPTCLTTAMSPQSDPLPLVCDVVIFTGIFIVYEHFMNIS